VDPPHDHLRESIHAIKVAFEKRQSVRYLFSGKVEALWNSERAEGTMEDRSEHGLGIRLKQKIEPGTKIRVVYRKTSYLGAVKNCRTADGFYLVGIELHTPQKIDRLAEPFDASVSQEQQA
jgi:hypothetical protein